MGTGWITWACLLLATGAPEPPTYYMNSRGFQIPLTVDASVKNNLREFIIYRSNDLGRTWQTYARIAPDKAGFDFLATEDGVFCFSIAVVDRRGVQEPPDVYKAPIGMKVVVDTTKPIVRMNAQRVRDEIVVDYEARDERPNWSTMKIEYKAGTAANWTPVPLTHPGERGRVSFRPGVAGDVTVRLSLADLAENVGMDERVVAGSLMTVANHSAGGANAGSGSGSLGETPLPGVLPPPGAAGTPPGGPLPGTVPAPPPPSDSLPTMPPAAAQPLDSGVAARPVSPAGSSGTPLTPEATPASVVPPAAGGLARGALPELQIVNKPQVRLSFDVNRIGPSGLGSVEVYVTTDEGNTWSPMRIEGGVQLPPASEMRVHQPVTGSVTVTLPRDNVIYGFIVIVRSKAGLGRPKPVPGDVPQLRVELDITPPEAKFKMPKPDPAHRDQMIFLWEAQDRNLADKPITLEWAERLSGPWEIIGEPQLPNTGSYSWKLPERLPPMVFLKMTVRDKAGNASQAITPNPVPLDTHVPDVSGVRLEVK